MIRSRSTTRILEAAAFLALGGSALGQNLDGDVLRWDADDGLYTAATDGDTLVWPPGVYDIEADVNSGGNPLGFCFLIHPAATEPKRPRTNLTIEASGVTLVVKDPTIGVFFLQDCDGLVIRGLRIVYDPAPSIRARSPASTWLAGPSTYAWTAATWASRARSSPTASRHPCPQGLPTSPRGMPTSASSTTPRRAW